MTTKRTSKRLGKKEKIFRKYGDKGNWKKPFSATVNTKKEAEELGDAIVFFHATKPKIEKIETFVRHKEGLVRMQGKPKYNVSSSGYNAY